MLGANALLFDLQLLVWRSRVAPGLVDDARLEEKNRRFYGKGWRLMKATTVAALRVLRQSSGRDRHHEPCPR